MKVKIEDGGAFFLLHLSNPADSSPVRALEKGRIIGRILPLTEASEGAATSLIVLERETDTGRRLPIVTAPYKEYNLAGKTAIATLKNIMTILARPA